MSDKETKKKEKKEKKKITYVDDGRSLADLSEVSGGFDFMKKGTTSSPKEIWETYWNAVKMMFKPMLVVLGIMCAVYLIAYILLSLA